MIQSCGNLSTRLTRSLRRRCTRAVAVGSGLNERSDKSPSAGSVKRWPQCKAVASRRTPKAEARFAPLPPSRKLFSGAGILCSTAPNRRLFPTPYGARTCGEISAMLPSARRPARQQTPSAQLLGPQALAAHNGPPNATTFDNVCKHDIMAVHNEPFSFP